MRDRRDYAIATLAAALIFMAGMVFGGGDLLPQADAQGQNTSGGNNNAGGAANSNNAGGGVTIAQDPLAGLRNRITTTAPTASDSNSNNRFVAVTTPIGSGESALFLIDSKKEQVAVYRFSRNKGLAFLAARKIDYDLKIDGYEDKSEFTRAELKREYEKQVAKAAAKAAKDGG